MTVAFGNTQPSPPQARTHTLRRTPGGFLYKSCERESVAIEGKGGRVHLEDDGIRTKAGRPRGARGSAAESGKMVEYFMALRCCIAPPLFSCAPFYLFLLERHCSLTCGLLILRQSVFLFLFQISKCFFLLIFRLDPVLHLLLWSITEVGQNG